MSKLIRAVQNSKTLAQVSEEREKEERAKTEELRKQKRQRAATAVLQKTWLGKRA